MPKTLTDAAVRKYRPLAGERREIPDGGAQGLYLFVQPSGHKSWHMRFRRPSGKSGNLVLGPYDMSGKEMPAEPIIDMPLTLAGARQLAAMVNRDRAMGIDVIAEYAARKQRRRAGMEESASSTFPALARKFIEEHARPKTRRWTETARLLGFVYPEKGEPTLAKNGLAGRWREKPVRDIDGHDIYAVVDEARRLGVPGIAARNDHMSEARGRALFSALSSMFGWLLRHRRVESNPCAGVHRPPAPAARERVLTPAEIRWFWAACDAVDAPRVPGAPRPFAAVLRLLLLTGQRLNEVAGMRTVELSEDGTTWNLGSDRTKNHRAHTVPLSPLAQRIIASANPRPGKAGLVFTTTGESAPSGWSRAKRRLDEAMLKIAREEAEAAGRDPNDVEIPGWRTHDLRRTCASGLAGLGVQLPVIERCLNHVSGSFGGIVGVYQKHEFADEKRAALERWAAHVQGLTSRQSAKVITMHSKGSRNK